MTEEKTAEADAALRSGGGPLTKREKSLAAAAAAGVALGIAGLALWATSLVPADSAAKVDDFYITEHQVAEYAAEYRARNQQTDDADFASALLQQNLNPGTFRQNSINQLALNALIDKRAGELGVLPSEEEVQEQVDSMKEQVAMGDEDTWQQTLQQYGTTEERLRAQFATNLSEKAIREKDVPKPEATDDQVRQHVSSARAGQTDVHSWQVIFKGNDSWQRAQECSERIAKAGKDLSPDVFSGFALAYSDDGDVRSDGGDQGWSAQGAEGSDYLDELGKLKDGEVSAPVTLDDQDATAIIYRDQSYTYPAGEKALKLNLSKLPGTLAEYLRSEASDVMWQADCSAYLANMLGHANITYYPMPDDADYNVDMTMAATTSTAGTERADE